jgi:F-box protein 21
VSLFSTLFNIVMSSHWLTDGISRVEDTSIRYVAEENVEIIEPEAPASLITLAGRYFKRWDSETHCFVSNIRDEYPDD